MGETEGKCITCNALFVLKGVDFPGRWRRLSHKGTVRLGGCRDGGECGLQHPFPFPYHRLGVCSGPLRPLCSTSFPPPVLQKTRGELVRDFLER